MQANAKNIIIFFKDFFNSYKVCIFELLITNKYITYTVVDYKDDIKDAAGVSCIQIILSVSNRKEKVVLLYSYDFLNNNFLTRLSDDIDVLVVF